MSAGARFLRWFAQAGGTKQAFYLIAWGCVAYITAAQRIPRLPHLPWFDAFPCPFLMVLLTIYGVLQNVAPQWMATAQAAETAAIRAAQDAHLTRVEQLEERILTAIEKRG